MNLDVSAFVHSLQLRISVAYICVNCVQDGLGSFAQHEDKINLVTLITKVKLKSIFKRLKTSALLCMHPMTVYGAAGPYV